MASAVGLDLVTSYYAADRVLRDQAHIELTKDSCALLGPGWQWRHEVPIGLPPDQRAWDAVGVHRVTGMSIRMEVETRLRNAQEKLRRIEAKRVADGEPRLVLALRTSTFNREAVRIAAPILEPMFPASPRAALAKLRVGEDPGANLLLLVGW